MDDSVGPNVPYVDFRGRFLCRFDARFFRRRTPHSIIRLSTPFIVIVRFCRVVDAPVPAKKCVQNLDCKKLILLENLDWGSPRLVGGALAFFLSLQHGVIVRCEWRAARPDGRRVSRVGRKKRDNVSAGGPFRGLFGDRFSG